MTSKDLIDACDILIKLEQEFSAEEAKLSEVSGEHAMRIDELDQQISRCVVFHDHHGPLFIRHPRNTGKILVGLGNTHHGIRVYHH